ncbi:hypothetical protein C7H85_02810 [Zobellella endophytica]|uniref:MSHA biogenesis protein MshQ n=2 Tax=Zobellella endophytica TaxID=2116700 RepID=A0A2P7RC02_9GAMM|nr:hypothetical protein C7H85_02810 [Zobellella endophytica]
MMLLAGLFVPLPALADAPTGLFPYAAQSHAADGELMMDWSTSITGARVMNDKPGYLDFRRSDGTLRGHCDGVTCALSGATGPGYALPAFNDAPVALPAFQTTTSSKDAVCTGSGTLSYRDSAYRQVSVGGSCRLYLANDGDTLVRDSLSASGSGTLYLEAGNYWVDSFSLSGSGKVVVTTPGDVNLYVRDQLALAGSEPLGSEASRVNVMFYGEHDIALTGGLSWHGDLYSRGEVVIGGSSEVHGAVQARTLKLEGSARLHQPGDDYWFEELELAGSARLLPSGDGLTRILVRDEIGLQGSAVLGQEGQALLLLVHGERDDDGDDGEVDLDGSAAIYGHLYIQGDLEMDGATRIYGAVNLGDLEMDGSSAIIYRELEAAVPAGVDHYELHFNSCSSLLTVKACADTGCSLLYDREATVHVKNQGHPSRDLHKFRAFVGQASQDISREADRLGYRFVLGYQATGKGNLDPRPDNDLVCYVDGRQSCTVNGRSHGTGFGSLTLDVDTGYAGDTAPLRLSGGCLAQGGEAEVEVRFDDNSSDSATPLTLSWPGNSETLYPGQGKTLLLPVTGATIGYPLADLLSLSIREIRADGSRSDPISDQAAFVPKAWRVEEAADCGGDQGFSYGEHGRGCPVLAVAGEPLGFAVSALDSTGEALPLDWLAGQLDNPLVSLQLRNGQRTLFSRDYGLSGFEATPGEVGVVRVLASSWRAGYIPGEDAGLVTEGDAATIGRTVPARLAIVDSRTGQIRGGVAHAGKAVAFEQLPAFTIRACAAGQDDDDDCHLTGYSGEFAGGLEDNIQLVLEAELDEPIAYVLDEPTAGQHRLTLVNDTLVFAKVAPFPETSLALPLRLDIGEHDLTGGDQGQVALTGESDRLRYGFLVLEDTELAVGEAGEMAARFYYYSTDTDTRLKDEQQPFALAPSAALTVAPALQPALSLTVAEQAIRVAPYIVPTEVEVEVEAPLWLQPYRDGALASPAGTLRVLEEGRRRANDRTFNRREVIR